MPRVTSGILNRIEGVNHGFFTRNGGVSRGIYASCNCGFGSQDDPANVAENRARVARRLEVDAARLVTAHQIHSADVAVVSQPWAREASPRADALVTREPGLAIGVLAADCVPILLADGTARVIGAAHAGWRGALAGVVEAVVARMCALGAAPERIAAAVGPAIGRNSYEVGPEFPAPFLAADAGNAAFFFPAAVPGRHLFDIKGYVASRLVAAGVANFAVLPNDSCAEERRFFSYRRSRLRGEPDYGRQISAIALEA